MRVRVAAEDAKPTADIVARRTSFHDLNYDYFLVPGTEYRVYGIDWFESELWFLVENPSGYLEPVPAVFFDLLDARASRHWTLTTRGRAAFLRPREINADEYFLDSLSDLDPSYVAKWSRIRRLLDNEFVEAKG